MIENFIKMIKEKEGCDLTKRDIIVPVVGENETEIFLQAIKNEGFYWCNGTPIRPRDDARNKNIFPVDEQIYIDVDPIGMDIFADSKHYITTFDDCLKLDMDTFMEYLKGAK